MKILFTIVLVATSFYSSAQTRTTEEQALEDWLPASIGIYESDGLPMTVTSKASDKPYMMSSKNYKKGSSLLNVVIFDYKESPELLKKYTTSWSSPSIDDETQKVGKNTVDELPGWESFQKKEKAAQLYINVKGRYLLYLSVTENTVEFLKSVTKELKPRQLPL